MNTNEKELILSIANLLESSMLKMPRDTADKIVAGCAATLKDLANLE